MVSATGATTGTYEQYLCRTVNKPSYTISEVEHKFLGNTYYYPGAVTWNTVQATLVNAVSPDGNKLLFDALYRSGHLDPAQQSDVFNGNSEALPATLNKEDSLNAFGNIIIRELDGVGNNIGTWKLVNPFLTNVTFGDLDYSSEELLNLEVTFRYDYALYGGEGETDPERTFRAPRAGAGETPQ
tara:strand:+ start:450 stop:1001 length:552 start_codon:yes stop_codon:yes gene_type:complete